MNALDYQALVSMFTGQPKDTPLFSDYAWKWYRRYKEPTIRPNTRRLYEGFLSNHLVPYFGEKPVGSITSGDVQDFYDSRGDLAHSTARQLKVVLHQIMASAIEDQLICTNPTESKRHVLPDRVTERNALTKAEIQDVIRQLPRLKEQDLLLLGLLIYTGERRGEAIGLRWEDIDFRISLIHVRRAVIHIGNRPIVTDPKSKAGIRDIPLLPELKKILTEHRRRTGYIIGDGVSPITETSFCRRWERIDRLIDLHGATPHVFRHTFLTMASDGIDTKTLQAIAGHSTYTLTFNRYVHKRDEKIRESASKLQGLFA